MFLLWYYLYLYFNFCTYQDCERVCGCQPVSVCECVFERAGVCTGVPRACVCMFSLCLNHWNQSEDDLSLVTHICDV